MNQTLSIFKPPKRVPCDSQSLSTSKGIMLRLEYGSGYAGGFLFIFIDIIGIWAIHRGLCALQSYYLFRAAMRNEKITLKRSHIPIVSGELLAGLTRFPSIFILAHAGIIALTFAAALGVEGGDEDVYKDLGYHYITSISTKSIPFENLHLQRSFKFAALECRDENPGSMTIWPLASMSKALSKNITCARNMPGLPPTMRVQCTFRGRCDIGANVYNRAGNVTLKTRLNYTRGLLFHTLITDSISLDPLYFPSRGAVPGDIIYTGTFLPITGKTNFIGLGSTHNNKTHDVLSWGYSNCLKYETIPWVLSYAGS